MDEPQRDDERWTEGLQGAEASLEQVVNEDMTAEHMGTGDVPVLATPMIVTLIERAAVDALEGRLPERRTTVGSVVRLRHEAPSAVGETIRVRVKLDEIQRRRLRFSFAVEGPSGKVASGEHVRVAVDRERFLAGGEAGGRGRGRPDIRTP